MTRKTAYGHFIHVVQKMSYFIFMFQINPSQIFIIIGIASLRIFETKPCSCNLHSQIGLFGWYSMLLNNFILYNQNKKIFSMYKFRCISYPELITSFLVMKASERGRNVKVFIILVV